MFEYKIDEELSLKMIDHQDAEELFDLSDRSRDHIRTWLPWINFTKEVEDTRNYIKMCLRRFAENDGLTVCILYHGKIAGVVDFHEMDKKNNVTSIGYWMGDEYKGRGLLTRACRVLCHYAFEELGMNRIEIRAASKNIKSRGVPERLGFKQEGVIRQAALLYDEYTDHVVYGILKEEWRKKEAHI
ncbi:ribosomal-protein-serine acetyltransferase [Halobacillus karajensis]|uniref:Ribosomal N-acetyltransferase YdaF n=1 Tax=Halobacillus karajensis TaxID=195088 RepID=A0A024P6R5_9BACI|nr:GNAT family protein [Halobacillus karajensis]CDQ20494.1 Putative ribosomal N-acetyltransferase YdaF [Halobacillus karajensis]CDQ24037.1 Putative ribosomal N-acetyltransferase YdaF [Halobacillus karajensis]CDQ27515.1 Putative ribosomal N-acetyltransferase YdaF [Halobacillus karajensis]SEH90890.1 ribosomal-protein-serine acetyltransferase [Halobacillus karajensis]